MNRRPVALIVGPLGVDELSRLMVAYGLLFPDAQIEAVDEAVIKMGNDSEFNAVSWMTRGCFVISVPS